MSECQRGSVSEGNEDELGSDIDLVVNSSAPAGLVAAFVCALAVSRGWGTAVQRSLPDPGRARTIQVLSHKAYYAFLRLHLRADL